MRFRILRALIFAAMIAACFGSFTLPSAFAISQPPQNPAGALHLALEFDDRATPQKLDFNKAFRIAITNTGKAPLNIHNPHRAPGSLQWTLQFSPASPAKAITARQRPIDPEAPSNVRELDNEQRAVLSLKPGQKFYLNVQLSAATYSDDFGLIWQNLPSPNAPGAFRLSATFQSPATPEAAREGVWTGRVQSPEVAVRLVSPELRTPVQLLWHGFADAALSELKKNRKWINEPDPSDRCTPLHHAVRFRHREVVKWLVDNGANVNAEAYNSFTPLYFADRPEIVRELLRGKPNLQGDDDQSNPLRRVAENIASARDGISRRRWTEIASQLRAAGAKDDLIVAIYLNDLPLVKKMLSETPEAATTLKYPTPLRLAAHLGRLEICKALIEIPEVDINDSESGSGYPIATGAVAHPEIMRLLIEHKADITSRISYRGALAGPLFINGNATLLHFAAAHGSPETIKLLIDHGVDPFAEAEDDPPFAEKSQTALDLASMLGQPENVLAIIRHPRFTSAEKSVRQAPLDRCLVLALRGRREGDLASFCNELIEAGANPNAEVDGYTAIQAAAQSLKPDSPKTNEPIAKAVSALRLAGAKVDLPSAVLLGDEQLVAELLQQSPASIKSQGPDRMPSLHLAAKMNHPKIVAQLLKAGCGVEMRDQPENTDAPGGTALHQAAFWGRIEITKQLLDAGANANALDEDKGTPLREAARRSHLELARLLLENGAHLDAKDDQGKSPLDYAEENQALRDLLEEYKARPKK